MRGFPIRLPALRDRREDIPLLAVHFLLRASAERGGPALRFDADARLELERRAWPGNVRELQHVVESLAFTVQGQVIGARDLPPAAGLPLAGSAEELPSDFKEAMRLHERRLLERALARSGGVKARAARELGLDPAQMKYLVRKHGLR
jgi:DNA-binding NtrC family response regulator